MNCGKICVLLLIILATVFGGTDYCDANLCNKGKKHIACGNNGDLAYICEKPEIIKITKNFRRLILRNHNSIRNDIAKGFESFPSAERMATMQWDNELAKLAELNVKQCEVRRDQCRNTLKFSFAGQNVGSTRWKETSFTISDFINSQIRAWFLEYNDCPLDIIKSYETSNCTAFSTSCSRFTTIIQDKSTHLGCAILRSVVCGYTQQVMVCNYAYDNMLGAPVYSDGQAASQCITGTNSIFPALCSVQEKYN